jgi:hypothetical protein
MIMSTTPSEALTETTSPVESAEPEEAAALVGEAVGEETNLSDPTRTVGQADSEVTAQSDAAHANAGEASQDAPAVYDSTARQRVPVTILEEDGLVDATLICEPVSDTTLATFARLLAEADATESPEDDEDATLKLSGAHAAGCWLFGALTSGVEGYGEEGEEMPGDWRDRLFGPREKADIIARAFFEFEPVPPPATKTKKRRS